MYIYIYIYIYYIYLFVCVYNLACPVPQGFTIENDCLTPTFKLKRPQLQKRYQAQINTMYQAIGEVLPHV